MTEAKTVRDLIRTFQREVRDTDLQPERGAEILTKLTALLGNCADEMREADAAYAVVLLKHLESEEAASRAKIRAETTPEYKRKREARDAAMLCTELVRSLKRFLQTKSDEMRLGGH